MWVTPVSAKGAEEDEVGPQTGSRGRSAIGLYLRALEWPLRTRVYMCLQLCHLLSHRFRSTQTSFKRPWQVLSEVVNLQMLQELVDMVGALGQVDHKSFACEFSLEPRFPRLLGKSAEKVKF